MTAHAVFAVGHVSRANDTVGIAFRNVKVLGCADDLATDMGRDSTARSGGHGVKRTEGWRKQAKESQKSGDLGARRCNQIGALLVWGAIFGTQPSHFVCVQTLFLVWVTSDQLEVSRRRERVGDKCSFSKCPEVLTWLPNSWSVP